MGVANSQLFVNLATGATGTIGAAITKFSVQPLNNGLYRISVAAIATGIVTSGPEVYIASADNTLSYTGDGTSGLYVWGNQAESATFSSSYMPTVAATVVRSSDLLTFSGANFTSIFNASEGSVVINAIPNSPTGNALNQVALAIGDGTGNNRIHAFRLAATGKYTFEVVTGGTTVTTISDTATWNEGSYGQLAFSYANASYAFSANGSVLTSSASGAIPTGLNKFDIGASSSDSNQFFGHIYRFAYYNKKITDIQVQNLAAL